MMTAYDLDYFDNELATVSGAKVSLSQPLDVFLDEALRVAAFHAKYWDHAPTGGNVVRLGLQRNGWEVGPATGAEILSLRDHVLGAQDRYLFIVDTLEVGRLVRRALVLQASLRRSLLCLPGVALPVEWKRYGRDGSLANRQKPPPSRSATASSLATALDALAAVGEANRDRLEGLEDHRPALLNEIRHLAKALCDRASALARGGRGELAAALSHRNRLLTLLSDRVRRVRAAARQIFKGDPAILSEVLSPYDRKRRERKWQ